VVEAAPDSDPGAKAGTIATLLDELPARVPIAIATRLHRVGALLPSTRHGARVVGLHLVRADPARPAVAEVAMPDQFDDGVVDGVLGTLESRGVIALPCGDAPGRIVDRLVATAWQTLRAAAAVGATPDLLAAGLEEAGLSLAAIAEDDRPRVISALHDGLGGPARFDPGAAGASAGADASLPLAERLALAAIAEGYRLVEEAVAGADEIERAMTAGAGWAAGPFTLAGRRGLRAVVTALAALARDPEADTATRDRFAMPSLLWTMATV
jgi:3-hydroxyacyl-CoA dehydrogenase